MKNIRNRVTDLGELNVALGTAFDTAAWKFLLDRIAYDEIVFDATQGTVTYPEFVPLEDMIRDVLAQLDWKQTVACVVCRGLFDLNEEDGIFGDPEKLERFLCRRCSEETSARDFYYKYLTGRG
ncbi:MAG: hypothetical protein JXQ29_14605 [Planctomycetes bacterium]|nr:hypothetical protein [Planctomycetota bacterium]